MKFDIVLSYGLSERHEAVWDVRMIWESLPRDHYDGQGTKYMNAIFVFPSPGGNPGIELGPVKVHL